MTIRNAVRGEVPSVRPAERARAAAGSVPDVVARDLASSRREVAALRRENERLRARLDVVAATETPVAPARPGERVAMWCGHCGVRRDARAAAHDRVLVLAACCPECDGPLVPVPGARDPDGDPSTYLG
jgi:hypothetical protein